MSGASDTAARIFAGTRKPVETPDVVTALESIGFTQKQIARAAGASDRSVRNWIKTGSIRADFDERVRELFEISLLLSDTLTGRGVTQWVSAKNALLDNQRPIDLIHNDQGDRVRGAVEAFLDGAYV
jgi:transcriptional regulator with XRE-family HTH domain